ncbi:hypothetical protein GCM10022251_42470 [Phytohabitans flavus]|uniref:Uncharacterized protein n=1 Tax=Phytohabitans flavus TaxID=1076124 RepID=A0A6F8XZ14_9ACTN|nr:hypothetical protein [Phytohabitans flavus]BCB79047.1 hypothetical protein Pflav_054570 [Phytohabitans flavus]
MTHGEAEHGSVEGEQHYLLGEHVVPGRVLRWVCGAGPQPVEESVPPAAPGATDVASGAPVEASDDPVDEPPPDEGRTLVPERRGPAVCRSSRAGWAGAHRHGAVRPQARATRRERPPDRWC